MQVNRDSVGKRRADHLEQPQLESRESIHPYREPRRLHMERREFLIRLASAVTAAPAALSLAGCGGDDDNGTGSAQYPTSPPSNTPTSPAANTPTSSPANTPTSPPGNTPTSPPGATATPPATRTATSGVPTASPTASPTPSPTPTTGLSDFTVTSSVVGAHSHTIVVRAADLAAGTGVTYTSSIAFGHIHTVTLTPQIIGDLNAGGTETVTSDPDSTGHSHDWVITEP
jgi:hypothetical protein